MNPLFKKIKKSVSVALVLMLALGTLTSCFAGIGNGALTIGHTETTYAKLGVEETVLEGKTDDSCVINIFNSEGHSSYIARPDAEAQANLRDLLEKGEYTAGSDTSNTGGTYIRVLFTDENGSKEAYLVYTNDVVKYSTSASDSFTSLGTQEGIYRTVRSFGDEANNAKSEASSRAGYSVSCLMVTVKSSYKPALTDFTELACIGIFHLMDYNTGETLYTFHFDSDTKEQIDGIAEKLRAYEGVNAVSYDYIMTLD